MKALEGIKTGDKVIRRYASSYFEAEVGHVTKKKIYLAGCKYQGFWKETGRAIDNKYDHGYIMPFDEKIPVVHF